MATIVIPVSSAALPGVASAQLRKKTPARGGFYRDPIRRLASDVVGYGRIPVVIDRGGPSCMEAAAIISGPVSFWKV